MSTENAPAPASSPAPATSELPAGGAAAPADGGVVASQPQHVDPNAPPAPQNAEEGRQPLPEHRTPQGRISYYSNRAKEAERVAAEERGRRLALEDMVRSGGFKPPADQAPAQPAAPTDPKPDPSKYDGGKFNDQYLEDVAAWSGRQEARRLRDEEREQDQKSKTDAEQRAETEANAKRYHATREAAAQAGYAEGGDLLRDMVRDNRIDLVDDITDSHNPAALAQWLALPKSDPNAEKLRTEVLRLPVRQRQRELARIDDWLTDVFSKSRTQAPQGQRAPAQPAPAPSVSTAPTPTPAPTAPSGGGVPFDPNKCSMEEYAASRHAQMGVRPNA